MGGMFRKSGEILSRIYRNWGIADLEHPARTTHFNAIQPWKIASDGTISDAMFA